MGRAATAGMQFARVKFAGTFGTLECDPGTRSGTGLLPAAGIFNR